MDEKALLELALQRMGEILEMEDSPKEWLDAASLVIKAVKKQDTTVDEILNRQLEQMDKTRKADLSSATPAKGD